MTRPPFIEKKMYKQAGLRWVYLAGALFMGLLLLVGAVSWANQGRALSESGTNLGSIDLYNTLTEQAGRVERTAGENPFGTLPEADRTTLWTLFGEEWESLPVEEWQFTTVHFRSPDEAAEVAEGLSPSGAVLWVRTGPVSCRKVELGVDVNRRVWQMEELLVVYEGGNADVEQLLQFSAGEPVADGRETDSKLENPSPVQLFVTWKGFPYLLICVGAGILSLGFLALALRTPGNRKEPSRE